MKPHMVGSSCHRVQLSLERSMGEGLLRLPAELRAHASRCARCGPEVVATERLLTRLRDGVARVDLGPVPQVVDAVLGQTASDGSKPAKSGSGRSAPRYDSSRSGHLRWVLTQVTIAVAVMMLVVGGLTFAALKVNQVVTGARPGEVVEKLAAPFRNWTWARFQEPR